MRTSLNIARQLSLSDSASERAVQTRRLRIAQMQERLNTGLRVNRPSDDPVAFEEARRLDDLDRRLAQYDRSIAKAQTWSHHTQDTLDDLGERFMQAYERSLQVGSHTFNDDDREAVAVYLEGVLEDVVTLLNEKEGDDYLFAGTNTTVAPFEQTGGGVTYSGNATGRAFQISEDMRLTVSISGERVQDTGDGFTIFESLQTMIDAVRSGDAAQLETALGQVATARDHVFEVTTEAGIIGDRLDTAELHVQQASLRVVGRRSQVEDADLTETLLEYQEAQTGLQAALKVTASVLQTSLLDYLRY